VLCPAVVHVFIIFRGLSSQAVVDQAQIAREVNLTQVPDTFHPPLQPALWAAAFYVAKPCIGWTV
jgi:hypothetical protein